MMTADIVTIGDEILIGQIVDTNSAFIAKKLNEIGLGVRQVTSVQDEKSQIVAALKNATQSSDVVIITGGLGPTNDDITKQTLCDYFQDELVLNEATLANLERIFKGHSTSNMLALNRNQAMLPSSATALINKYGTASGMWFDQHGKVYVSLPGVPFEMKALLVHDVIPRLIKRFKRPAIVHRTMLTYGLPESVLAQKIEKWENDLPAFIKLAYLPNLGMVRLRLSAQGEDENKLKTRIDEEFQKLYQHIGDHIRGFEEEGSIAVQIAKFLTKNRLTLGTVESCTGGKIAAAFTENPGASAYFKGSIVSYASPVKTDLLKIPQAVIAKHSVVSEEVAKLMALKGKELLGADYVISTTGNAGPTKGDSNAEIGTVIIALAGPDKVQAFSFQLGNHREKVLHKTLNKAMEILWKELV